LDKAESALVSHEEVQNWASGGRRAIICSISHTWEAREHPDPCQHQLQHMVNHAGLFGAAFDVDIWVYYDYVCLFQYERFSVHEKESFRKAMQHMHLLYAHECTLTFSIETLPPEHLWERLMRASEDLVPIWDVDRKNVVAKPLKDMMQNRTPFRQRGWCIAEVEWSLLRMVSAQFQQIEEGDIAEDGLNGRVPTAPDHFRKDFHEHAQFTHRADAASVIYLQEVVFREKVTLCEHLVLIGLPVSEMLALSRALPHYENLRSMNLKTFRCGKEEATFFCQAFALSRVEKLEVHNNDLESSKFLVEAILATREPRR